MDLAAVVAAQVLASSELGGADQARDVIPDAAPAWSAAIFGLVAAAPVEESAFRGALLFAVAGLTHLQQSAVLSNRGNVALQLTALAATSLVSVVPPQVRRLQRRRDGRRRSGSILQRSD